MASEFFNRKIVARYGHKPKSNPAERTVKKKKVSISARIVAYEQTNRSTLRTLNSRVEIFLLNTSIKKKREKKYAFVRVVNRAPCIVVNRTEGYPERSFDVKENAFQSLDTLHTTKLRKRGLSFEQRSTTLIEKEVDDGRVRDETRFLATNVSAIIG